jgi:integrase
LFSPAEAVAEWQAAKREARVSKVPPSQRARGKRRPRRTPGDHYTVETYRHAIAYGIKRAKVDHWHANQLRHSAATRIRAKFGLEASQTVLGHASADVTQVYAERDQAKAREIMAKVG